MNTKISIWLKDHSLAAFIVLAYGLSWAIEIPLALSARGGIRTNIPTSLHYLSGYGPMIAAILITWLTGGNTGLKDLFKRMTKWRVKPIWWLFAFSPLAVYLVANSIQWGQLYWRLYEPSSQGFTNLAGLFRWVIQGQWFALMELGWVEFLPGLGLAALPMWILTFGIGEETGWRGFALPQLQKNRSPLTATFILWVVWAFWHLPLFLYSYELSILPGFTFGLLAGAITFTWLYNGTGGSIFMVALWHGTFNFVTACVACKSGFSAPIVSIAVMVWATLIVINYQQSRSRGAGKKGFHPVNPEEIS